MPDIPSKRSLPDHAVYDYLKAFQILSIKQIEPYHKALGLTTQPTHELRVIIRDQLKIIDKYNYDSLYTQFDEIYSIYRNIFLSIIDGFGEEYGTEIYHWVINLYSFIEKYSEISQFKTSWDTIFISWESNLNGRTQQWLPLPFTEATVQELKNVIVKHNKLSREVKGVVQALILMPADEWETKLRKTRGLKTNISLQMKFVIDIWMWRKIFSILDQSDLRKFENWVQSNIIKSRLFHYPRKIDIDLFDMPIHAEF